MDRTDTAYRGLAASSWDVYRDDTAGWPDREIWRDVIARFGEPVLDLGCASGRLLLEFLAAGIDADGLDASGDMLDIVRGKAAAQGLPAPTLFQQSLEELASPRGYRTVLGASSVLQLVTEPAAVTEVLRRIFDHLEPGGAFAGSFDFEWRAGDPVDTGWELLFDKPRPEDGARMRCWTREWREPEHQLWHNEQRFEVELDGAVISSEHHRRSPEGRWYRPEQVRDLLVAAGFEDVQLFSGFTHEPVKPDDRLLWALAVKPFPRD